VWDLHLEEFHAEEDEISSGPRPVDDPDLIIGSEARR
jgi:hypothetical protein